MKGVEVIEEVGVREDWESQKEALKIVLQGGLEEAVKAILLQSSLQATREKEERAREVCFESFFAREINLEKISSRLRSTLGIPRLDDSFFVDFFWGVFKSSKKELPALWTVISGIHQDAIPTLIDMIKTSCLPNLQNIEFKDFSYYPERQIVALFKSMQSYPLPSLQHVSFSGKYGRIPSRKSIWGELNVTTAIIGYKRVKALVRWLQSEHVKKTLKTFCISSLTGSYNNVDAISRKGMEMLVKSIDGCTKIRFRHNGDFSTAEEILVAALERVHDRPPWTLSLSGPEVRDEQADGGLAARLQESHLLLLDNLFLDFSVGRRSERSDFAIQALPFQDLKYLTVTDPSSDATQIIGKSLEKGSFINLSTLSVLVQFPRHQPPLAPEYFAEWIEPFATWLESGKASKMEELNIGRQLPSDAEQILLRFARILETTKLRSLREISLFPQWVSLSLDVRRALSNAYKTNSLLKARLYNSEEPRELRALREYNESLQALEHQNEETGTYGKVFICGDPRIGKTTLRKTLLISGEANLRKTLFQKLQSQMNCCFKPKEKEEEPPTRGIEVHHMQFFGGRSGRPEFELELAVWDMAGQSEYEVLQSAFLPDLALADGQATFFVVVCSANAGDARESGEEYARASLCYWLRFIASNSSDVVRESLRRKVLVILNCFGGQRSGHDLSRWTDFLRSCQGEFQDLLELQPEPFIMDAEDREEVSSLKSYLAREGRRILQERKVPRVVASILRSCRQWVSDEKNQEYPVVSWATFSSDVVEYSEWSLDVMKAATIYLHEAGHLVLFKELKKHGSSSEEDDFENQAVLVLHPHWFCHRVMGHLLLPEQLLRDGEKGLVSKYLNADGSLPLALVSKEVFQISTEHLEETIEILVRLQLCYLHPTDNQRVFIPSLIRDDDLPRSFLEAHQTSSRDTTISWVMGFSLAPEHPDTNLLPIGVFRKLQVDLAYDEDIGRKPDRSFKAGISRISFMWKGMALLVEFKRDPRQAKYERIDILVQPRIHMASDARSQRQRQVYCGHHLVERTQGIAMICCPNVRLKRLIIQPWERSARFLELEERKVDYSVDEMVLDLKQSIKSSIKDSRVDRRLDWYTNWKIGGEFARFEDLLPEKDWGGAVDDFEENCERRKSSLHQLGILSSTEESGGVRGSDGSIAARSTEAGESVVSGSNSDFQNWLRNQFNLLHERHNRHDRDIQGLKESLSEIIQLDISLYKRVQSLETFTIEEKRSSVPRFPYLTAERRCGSAWKNIKDAIKSMFSTEVFLHFLCESGHADSKLHEVDGQEGIRMRERKDWVEKIAPALMWSLKIAFWALKISGQVILPGLGLLVQGIPHDIVSNEATNDHRHY